ncbi:MAG: hypothetical protein WBM75_02830 [Polyangiales bacterium]
MDDTTVKITVGDAGGSTETPTVVNNGDGTFSASLELGSYPNESLSVACEASDSSAEKRCSSATVMTFLDLGPSVVILSPDDGSVQAGGMDVEFTIAADPVSDSDTMAAPVSGTVIVAGAEISDIVTEGDVSIATVDFDDPDLYQTALNGEYEFSVSVTNGRGVTRRAASPWMPQVRRSISSSPCLPRSSPVRPMSAPKSPTRRASTPRPYDTGSTRRSSA